MNFLNRIYVFIGTLFWGVFLFWLIGSIWFLIITILGIIYLIVGGKLHV